MLVFKITAGGTEMSSDPENGTREEIPLSEEASEIIDSIGQIIGHGGQGAVYTHINVPDLAIKEIRTDNIAANSLDKLVAKLNMLTHLAHANVLSHNKIIPAPGFLYVTMPRCDKSAEQILRACKRKQQRLPTETVFKIMQHVSTALAYLHAPNKLDGDGNELPVVVHGDLKPDNILASSNADSSETKFVVADIGLHEDVICQDTRTTNAPLYAAPEVLYERKVSTAADMWSFGAILYELETCMKFMPYGKGGTGFSLPNNWVVDLRLVKDTLIKSLLEHLLVVDPKDRLSAEEVATICGPANETTPLSEMMAAATARMCEFQIQKNREKHRVHLFVGNGSTYGIWPLDFDALLESTNLLTEEKVDENEKLMWAVRNDNASLVKSLLDKGVKLKRTRAGMTCLMYAAQIGSVSIVQLLINREQRMQDDDGKTALMYAVINGHTNIVELLCSSESMMQDNNGRTALMYSMITRRYDLISILLKYENCSQDHIGATALMYAARIGDIKAIEILAGKEANIKDRHNETATFYALRSGNMKAAKKLDTLECPIDSIGRTVLMLATTQNNLEKIRLFIPLQGRRVTSEAETFLNLTVKKRTALMEAAVFGRIEAVKLLMEREVKMQDENGLTALMFAAAGGHIKIVELLIEHEKSITDKSNQTALHYVVKNASMELLELLVSHIDPTDDKGVTALMRAADRGDTQIVKSLIPLQKGLTTTGEEKIERYVCPSHMRRCIDMKISMSRRTALMGAAARENTEIIKLLLDHEKGMTDSKGHTALWIAKQFYNQDAIEILSKCPEENQ